MKIIETHEITKNFGDLIAVNNLSISVDAGEVFGLLGPNGAGKTTLIKMLITLMKASSGHARVAGFDVVKQAADVRRSIGYVPQMLSIDSTLSGYENLLFYAKLYDIRGKVLKEKVKEALEFMGLTDVAHKLVRKYSGGMIRRLEIAQSFIHNPLVMFLDEPTVGLDPLARDSVWQHIVKLQEKHNTTILLTTHLMEEADKLCDRVAIMHHGKIAIIGKPDDLKASLKKPHCTLNDVFIHYTSGVLTTEGDYREISRARRTARRMG